MVATFDYKEFAENLTKQAEINIPQDIAQAHKKEFLERIYGFTYIAGEAFSKDENIEDSTTAKVLTQIISEWTFHKYIDLLRSDIPAMYHESILQKVGFVAFEMTREATLGKLSHEEMLNLVEIQLKKAFEKACAHLLTNGQISQEVYDSAMKQSNIDATHTIYAREDKKNFKTHNYTICALTFALMSMCANVFCYEWQYLDIFNTCAIVILSMYVGFYIGVKKVCK